MDDRSIVARRVVPLGTRGTQSASTPRARERRGQPLLQPAETIPTEWLENFEATDQARRLDDYQRRLVADANLIHDLQWTDFTGHAWERLATVLAEYGYQVAMGWIITGEIFGKCRAKGLRGIGDTGTRSLGSRTDAEELAYDTVALAIVRFRDNVLRKNRWDAAGGASLKTFFIGQVLIQFVSVYRDWVRAQRKHDPLDVVVDMPASALSDPAAVVMVRLELEAGLSGLDELTRRALLLREAGYSMQEVAELVGLPSARAVTTKLYRHRHSARSTHASA